MGKQAKTNAMRILERLKIPYTAQEYESDGQAVDGVTVAQKIGEQPERVYKTLLTTAGPRAFYVFVIPVAEELDLKKAAKAAGVKSLAMLHVKDLLPTTGYVRGGCSPVGMKKLFPTYINETAKDLPYMLVSAGRIGAQLKLAPGDLARAAEAQFAPLIF